MNMYNIRVLVKSGETVPDVIAELCDEANVEPDEHFCFSAIMRPMVNGCKELKLNCLLRNEDNPYSAVDVASNLMLRDPVPTSGVVYIQPKLEQWLAVFKPMLLRMVSRVKPRYERLIPERDDLMSILYVSIVSLYNKGYYLHNSLIYKTYINALNMECRSLKHFQNVDSLFSPVGVDDDGRELTYLDKLADTSHYYDYEEEYAKEQFALLRDTMLQDMSQLQFDRILIQLATKTVDRSTSYKLNKYRELFNPGWSQRPNAKGKNKGGKK